MITSLLRLSASLHANVGVRVPSSSAIQSPLSLRLPYVSVCSMGNATNLSQRLPTTVQHSQSHGDFPSGLPIHDGYGYSKFRGIASNLSRSACRLVVSTTIIIRPHDPYYPAGVGHRHYEHPQLRHPYYSLMGCQKSKDMGHDSGVVLTRLVALGM